MTSTSQLAIILYLSLAAECWTEEVPVLPDQGQPLVLAETGRYNCLLFNDSRGLVCDILDPDAGNAVAGLPAMPWPVTSLTLVLKRVAAGSMNWRLSNASLAQFGQLEFLQVKNFRRSEFGLTECALKPLATSLRSLDLHGFSGVLGASGDPFCTAGIGVASLTLELLIRGCESLPGLINRTASSLKDLHVSVSPDCNIANFQIDGLPQLERFLLRVNQPAEDGVERSGGGAIYLRQQSLLLEESLSNMRFRNLPNLRSLSLLLQHKAVLCPPNGSLLSADTFVNLTSLETLRVVDMFVLSSPSPIDGVEEHCELLAPGAYRGGSDTLQLVELGAVFIAPFSIDLRNNAELLWCHNCSKKQLTIWIPPQYISMVSRCRLLLPEEPMLNVTHLRVSKCQMDAVDAIFLNKLPQLRSLVLEPRDSSDFEGRITGQVSQLVSSLNLDDLAAYLINNSQLEQLSVFAQECVCATNTSDGEGIAATPMPEFEETRLVSVGCSNIHSQPFPKLATARLACRELAAFPAQIQRLVDNQKGQCVLSGQRVLSCVFTRNFFRFMDRVPYSLEHLDCLLNTSVQILRRRLLARAVNLRVLVLSGAKHPRALPEGLVHIEDRAFQALKSLETLVLRNNRLTELNSETFYGLARLKHLDLSNNYELTRLDPLAVKPTRATLCSLRLTLQEERQLSNLIAESELVNLQTLNVVFLAPLKILTQSSFQKPDVFELPAGSIANLNSLRELALSFDDYAEPRSVVLQFGSIANLPSLRSLSVRLDNALSTLTLEPRAFRNLAGRTAPAGDAIQYLALPSLQYPVPMSNWLQLLSGLASVDQEIILGFQSAQSSGLFFDDLSSRNVTFNTSRLTLSFKTGCRVLSDGELGTLGRVFPRLHRLTLQPHFAIDVANYNVLDKLRSSAVQLARLDAVPSNCGAMSKADTAWEELLPGVPTLADSKLLSSQLQLRLSCSKTLDSCDFDNAAASGQNNNYAYQISLAAIVAARLTQF